MFGLFSHITARPFHWVFFLCAGLAVAGCGGGGGSSGSDPGVRMQTCTNGDGGTVMVPATSVCPTTRVCSDGSTIAFSARCPTTVGLPRQCPGSSTITVPEQSTIGATAALCEDATGLPTTFCPGTTILVLVSNQSTACLAGNTNVSDFIDNRNSVCPGGVTRDPVTMMCPPPDPCDPGEVRNPVTMECQMPCPGTQIFDSLGSCVDQVTSCSDGEEILNNVCVVICPSGVLTSGSTCQPTGSIRPQEAFQRACTPFGSVSPDDDYELRTNCPLTLTNIQSVREKSPGVEFSGDGVLVGVVDERLDILHEEFRDTVRPGRFTVYNLPSVTFRENGEDYTFTVTVLSPHQHGNEVTGILAAKKDADVNPQRSLNMRGVAYGSDVLFYGLGDSFLTESDNPLPVGLRTTRELLNAFAGQIMREFIAEEARVVTRSITFFPEGVQRPPEGTRCPPPSGPNLCEPFDITNFFRNRPNARTPASNVLSENGVYRLAEAMFPPTDTTSDAYAIHPIFVHAAGNQGLDNPDVSMGLSLHYTELQDHFVSVVAVDGDGVIADFSNRCGMVADWCIAAPGVGIVVPTFFSENIHARSWIGQYDDGYDVVNGTSFSAPIVAGALALMIEAFGTGTTSNMPSDEILDRLYATATKTGIYEHAGNNANGARYGQGLLNIAAALAPDGDRWLIAGLGSTNTHLREGRRFRVGTGGIFLSHAFGNAVERALAGRDAVFFDSLDTAFAFPALDFLRTNAVIHDPFRHLHRARQGQIAALSGEHATLVMSLGYDAPIDATPLDDYFNLVRDGPSLSMQLDISGTQSLRASLFMGRARDTQSLTEETPDDTYGAHIAYGVSLEHLFLELEAGYLLESNQILGAYPQGIFAHEGKTPTFFAGIAGTYALADDWEGRAHARVGRTTPDAGGIAQTSFHDITPITSSAFSTGLYRRNLFAQDDALGFVVAQPLRIEDGSAELTYAVGRTRNKILLEETLDIPLAPEGRALDIGLVYEGEHIMLSAGATLNARHEKSRTDAHIAVRLFRRF